MCDTVSKKTKTLNLQDIHRNQCELTGLIYDERMLLHAPDDKDPTNLETPERISASFQRCEERGLIKRCRRIQCPEVTDEDLLRVHSQEHINHWKKMCSKEITADEYNKETLRYFYVFFNQATWKSALLSAGAVLEMTKMVITGDLKNGMTLTRPPGHHAMINEACGFCVVNNIAIAAKYALEVQHLQRILIVDWDVHHGQATQYAFYNDPRVLYFSIHRYEHKKSWPFLRESDYDFIGRDAGLGYNINVPLNEIGMGNAEYLAIFHHLLLPIAYEFNPELVLVSCGYDAAIGCPLGEMSLYPQCYAHLVHKLMSLAKGKLVLALEGGYCIKSLAEGVAYSLQTLLGDACPLLENSTKPCASIMETIRNAVGVLRPIWKCLECFDYNTDSRVDTLTLQDSTWQEVQEREKLFGFCFPVSNVKEQSEVLAHKMITLTLSNETVLNKLDEVLACELVKMPENKVGICYDNKMLDHVCIADNAHPEKPERIKCVYEHLCKCNLWKRCKVIESRDACDAELTLVHNIEHITKLKSYSSLQESEIRTLCETGISNSVYYSNNIYQSSITAVGCLLNLIDGILNGDILRGAAIIRPPGHHAVSNKEEGFCYVNNVAIATRYALTKKNSCVKRVAIIDWDVHHGNGTQEIFQDDADVLYISLHRHDNGSFYPFNDEGSADKVGVGLGIGKNINIAWNTQQFGIVGDAEYINAFNILVLPVCHEFNPDLIIISAGFDAAIGDPLGKLLVTPECFGHLTHMLANLAQGRMILAFEGGYNFEIIAKCWEQCIHALLGDSLKLLEFPCISNKTGTQAICDSAKYHKKFWKCLQLINDSMFTEQINNMV